MRILFYILITLTILFGITFAVLNATPVTFHYYLGTKELPLSFLVALSFTVGAILGWICSITSLLRTKREVFQLKYQIKKLKHHGNKP